MVDVIVTREAAVLFSGSSCYCAAAAAITAAYVAATTDAAALEMTVVCGLSFFCSAAADAAATMDAEASANRQTFPDENNSVRTPKISGPVWDRRFY